MVDSKTHSQSHSPSSSIKPSGGRQRVISSCLTCRRRKVKCDHVHPICGACTRGGHVCTYATDQGTGQPGRISKPMLTGSGKMARNSDVQARLDRLELLLERAVSGQMQPTSSGHSSSTVTSREPESGSTPSSNSQTSQGAGLSSDNHDGTLLLDDGQSQFVSSLHYALLAEEIQDIKALLGDKSDEETDEPTQNNLIHLLSLGRAKAGVSLHSLLPESQEHQDALLDLYFSHVDPMIRITHKQTVLRKFSTYIREAQPIAFAIFYSAINAIPPGAVQSKFGESKEELLTRFQLGVEISLARENYLTTSSLEVFQGFIIWLTCITKEEDMGKAWALLGIAIRIALNQGLHRDPSLFPGSMDDVTIELRRRMWHQICHLEFRAAECKGQEPSLSEDHYTTLLPRNIDDDELIPGASPGPRPYNEDRFTDMTFQIIRFSGMRALRKIVQSTFHLERRMMQESALRGTSGSDPAHELQTIYRQIRILVDNMHEENYQKYLRHCKPDVPLQKLCLGLEMLLEWRCYLIFWLRMPRAYRDVVFADDIRRSIFEKSVNCIERLNGASLDADAARFKWHIGGVAVFQAIMHVLSELRNPLFDAPGRERALRALHMSRLLKEDNNTKAWSSVKNMIDKMLRESSLPLGLHSGNSTSFGNGSTPDQASLPITDATPGASLQLYAHQTPAYSIPRTPESVSQHSVQPEIQPPLQPQAQPQLQPQAPPQPQSVQPMQTVSPDQVPFNWDDLNFNNIIGDPQQNPELPEFDFGFWGDPVNFMTDPVNLSMDGNTFTTPWTN